MMKNFVLLLSLSVFIWIVSGCENPDEYKFEPKLVVNGQLTAGAPIDSIYITWSADITDRYDTPEQWVRNADVRINDLQLREYNNHAGLYYYPNRSYRVASGETYRLEVRAEGEYVFSETTVPAPFSMNPVGVSAEDTVQYVAGSSWFSPEFFILEWPGYTGSRIFRIVSTAARATPENFIEDDRTEALVAKGEEEDRENPAIWWVADDFVRVNWMFFNWTGWHTIVVSAVDSNYYNYRNGILFGEQSGQNFNTVVKNGYGLFHSVASDTIKIYLVK